MDQLREVLVRVAGRWSELCRQYERWQQVIPASEPASPGKDSALGYSERPQMSILGRAFERASPQLPSLAECVVDRRGHGKGGRIADLWFGYKENDRPTNAYLEGKVAWAYGSDGSPPAFVWARDQKVRRWLTPEELTKEAAGQLTDIADKSARLVIALITVLAVPVSTKLASERWDQEFSDLLERQPTDKVGALDAVVEDFNSGQWEELRGSAKGWKDAYFYPRGRLAFHVLR